MDCVEILQTWIEKSDLVTSDAAMIQQFDVLSFKPTKKNNKST